MPYKKPHNKTNTITNNIIKMKEIVHEDIIIINYNIVNKKTFFYQHKLPINRHAQILVCPPTRNNKNYFLISNFI